MSSSFICRAAVAVLRPIDRRLPTRIATAILVGLAAAWHAIMTMLMRRMERRVMLDLARLDDRLLQDIGLVRGADGTLSPRRDRANGQAGSSPSSRQGM